MNSWLSFQRVPIKGHEVATNTVKLSRIILPRCHRDTKPRFLYVGNMHGDEPTGRQLCLAYALDLITSSSAQAENLREHSHNIIIPTLNPDGFDLRTRGNKCVPPYSPSQPTTASPAMNPSSCPCSPSAVS